MIQFLWFCFILYYPYLYVSSKYLYLGSSTIAWSNALYYTYT